MLRRLSARQLKPLAVPGFRLLFLSTLGSSIGTLLAAVALAIDVKDRTNSGLWVGAVTVVEFLPTILVGLTLGPLLDRLQRRALMVGADLMRAAVFCALPFATSAGEIVVLAAVAGVATGFFRPAVYAGVPNLVPEEQLPEANALLQTIENASWAIGPLVGGVLTAAAGPHPAYWLDAASFLVSAILVFRIPRRLLQSETALTRGHWRDLADGFAVVLRSRTLVAVLVAWSLVVIGSGAVTLSEVFLAKDTFHAGDFGYGLLYGAVGVGLVLGSWWSSVVVERIGTINAYAIGMVVMAAAVAIGAITPDVWLAAACLLLVGIGDGVAIVCNALLAQRGAPDHLRGRAVTVLMSVTFAFNGAGVIVAGAIVRDTGARWIWGGAAATFALGALAAWVIAREPREVHAPAEVPAD
ncbi:MAG: MFS transporter [Gaiellaceae bacterium]